MKNKQKIIGYAFYCYLDLPKWKIKKGMFLNHWTDDDYEGKTKHKMGTKHITQAEIYDDYDMINEIYDGFCFADHFWIIPIYMDGKHDTAWSFYSKDITKNKKDQIVKLNFNVFYGSKNVANRNQNKFI